MIQIDMQMPKNCLDCPACNEYLMCAIPVNGRKWGENDVREFGQGRPEWCPMKEQEAFQWINVKDKLPEKDGQYLVVYAFFDYRGMGVVRFSHNLHEIDEYIFDTENRPWWYEPDDEVGYFERTTVTHWAKLPEFPKEGQ